MKYRYNSNLIIKNFQLDFGPNNMDEAVGMSRE